MSSLSQSGSSTPSSRQTLHMQEKVAPETYTNCYSKTIKKFFSDIAMPPQQCALAFQPIFCYGLLAFTPASIVVKLDLIPLCLWIQSW